MKNVTVSLLVVLAALIGTNAAAGERGRGTGPRRFGEGRPTRPGQSKAGPHRFGEGRPTRPGQGKPGDRLRARARRRAAIAHRLLNTEAGKTLREELQEKVKALAEEHKALRDAIREEIQGGKKPGEVLPAYRDKLKALLKKRLLLRIEFQEKLLALAKQNVDKAVDKIHEKMRERGKGRLRRREGKGGDRADRPRDRRRRRPHPKDEGEE